MFFVTFWILIVLFLVTYIKLFLRDIKQKIWIRNKKSEVKDGEGQNGDEEDRERNEQASDVFQEKKWSFEESL